MLRSFGGAGTGSLWYLLDLAQSYAPIGRFNLASLHIAHSVPIDLVWAGLSLFAPLVSKTQQHHYAIGTAFDNWKIYVHFLV